MGIEANTVALFAKNNVDIGKVSGLNNYPWSEGGYISVRAGNNTSIESMHASRSVNISTAGRLDIDNLTIDGDFDHSINPQPASGISVGKDANIGFATVTGDLGIDANGDINYNNAGGIAALCLTSKNGSINLGNKPYGWMRGAGNYQKLVLDADQKVSMTGDMFVDGDLSVTAGKRGIFLPAYLRVTGNTTLTTPGNITTSNMYGGWYIFDSDLTYVVSSASKIGNGNGRPLNTAVYGNETKIVK